MKISQSQIKFARKCWQAYTFKYVEKLRPRRKKRPFAFGGIVHDMLDAQINGDDPFEVLKKAEVDDGKMFASEKELYGDIIEDIRLIMTAYFEFWPDRNLRYIRLKGRSAEHRFEVEIDKDITINGKIDGFAESPNGFRWLVEHKTFTRFPKDDHRWRNIQSAVYIRIVEMLGWLKKRQIDGTCWDYVWSKPPTIPNVLKNGNLSRAKIDTLHIVVREEIEKLGLSPRDNDAVLTMAGESQKEYFKRIFTPVDRGVIDFLFKECVDTAREIVEYHGRKSTMNVDFHCDNCEYEPLCRARLLGDDVDFLKERHFYADTQAGENEADVEQ